MEYSAGDESHHAAIAIAMSAIQNSQITGVDVVHYYRRTYRRQYEKISVSCAASAGAHGV